MRYLAACVLFFLGVGVFPFNLRVISSPAGLMFFVPKLCIDIFFIQSGCSWCK